MKRFRERFLAIFAIIFANGSRISNALKQVHEHADRYHVSPSRAVSLHAPTFGIVSLFLFLSLSVIFDKRSLRISRLSAPYRIFRISQDMLVADVTCPWSVNNATEKKKSCFAIISRTKMTNRKVYVKSFRCVCTISDFINIQISAGPG